MKKAAVIMSSEAELPIAEKTAEAIKGFGVEVTLRIMSAHRSPKEVTEFAENAYDNGYGVIVAAAGMAAHLAGTIAAHTVLPVIALPVKSKSLEGLDSLLSAVMMPPGVPVAAVAVDGALNAGYLAVQILAVSDKELSQKFIEFKESLRVKNVNADTKLQEK